MCVSKKSHGLPAVLLYAASSPRNTGWKTMAYVAWNQRLGIPSFFTTKTHHTQIIRVMLASMLLTVSIITLEPRIFKKWTFCRPKLFSWYALSSRWQSCFIMSQRTVHRYIYLRNQSFVTLTISVIIWVNGCAIYKSTFPFLFVHHTLHAVSETL